MGIVFAVLVFGFLIGFAIYNGVKESKLKAAGEITKRSTKDLTKKAEIFTTKIKSLKEIYKKLEERDLARHKITMEYTKDRINFSVWRMTTSLSDLGGGKYRLVVDSFIVHRTNGIKTGVSDTLEMNLIFTAVEKVMLELDKDTEIEEEFVKRRY
jgi:hypothetical protein